jgi:hypothetical protein
MLPWAGRHPIITWALAWAATGVGLQIADVFSEPRGGPLWVGVVAGALAWGFAGGATSPAGRWRIGALAWSAAYLVAFLLAAILGTWFELNQVGSVSSAGFIGMLLGWGAGAVIGALVGESLSPSPDAVRVAIVAVTWGAAFVISGFFALIFAMILGQLAKGVLGFLGSQRIALLIGWGTGWAIGGLMAASLGVSVRRLVARSREGDRAKVVA